MNIVAFIIIGTVFGVLGGVGIFFEPNEPYKWQIFCASTLKGVLIGLLTGFSAGPGTAWWSTTALGALYGFLFGVVIYLAKGGPKSGDAPYVIPSGLITGGLTGLCIWIFAMR